MRGLSKYRPFDAKYFDVFPKDVCIGSICPASYSSKFSEFIKRLNSTISADKLSDYVHHYTGFSNIYNCRLEIPETPEPARESELHLQLYGPAVQLRQTTQINDIPRQQDKQHRTENSKLTC